MRAVEIHRLQFTNRCCSDNSGGISTDKMVTELKNGVFVDRDKFLEDLSKAHREGLFTNVTFTLSDDVEISTNKFMLACRSPFFATMLFCELKEGSSDKIELKCCDSKIMGKVLDFIWEGKADLSAMDIQSLLDILAFKSDSSLDFSGS